VFKRVRQFKNRTLSDDHLTGGGSAAVHNEDGFTVVEMMLAMMLFLIVSAPLAGVLTASAASQKLSRERTLAQQTAMAQIESIRALPYASVGTVNGNPPGTVVANRAVNVTGLSANVVTQIQYVNDPTPTSYITQADYKRVTVTVTRVSDSKQLTKEVTYVAPPGSSPYGGVNATIIKATVVDYALNTPIPNATVNLATGPSAPRGDVTDSAGSVVFPALTANPTSGAQAYYDISAVAPGYTTLKDDVSPAAAAHAQLAPGQTFNTVLRVYRPATINVLVNTAAGGGPYTGTATVTIGSPRTTQSFTVTGGSLSVTALNGEPIVPGLPYTVSAQTTAGNYAPAVTATVPNAYPTDLTSTFTLMLSATTYTTSTLTVKVQTSSGAAVKGARVEVSGGPVPTYISAFADAMGSLTVAVPPGSGYTVNVKGVSGEGAGTWTGSVTTSTTTTIKVS
jgi:type II secretory pathway pseudopilin PulG